MFKVITIYNVDSDINVIKEFSSIKTAIINLFNLIL